MSDPTYVWTARRFVHTAFVIEVFSRRIVGWRTADHLRTDLVLDAPDQAVYDRLDAVVSIAALADFLGHANPSVTLNVYSHMMPNTSGRVRDAIDRAHRRDVGRRRKG